MGQHFGRACASALALVCASACASPSAHAPAAAAPAEREIASRTAPAEPRKAGAPPWSTGSEITSNAGAYRLVYRATPAPIPRGEVYALDVWVFDAHDATRPLTDVALAVDASMPEHQHGMTRRPIVKRTENGGFRVEGLLFHMPGRWELYFDVTRAAITERAQVTMELL